MWTGNGVETEIATVGGFVVSSQIVKHVRIRALTTCRESFVMFKSIMRMWIGILEDKLS